MGGVTALGSILGGVAKSHAAREANRQEQGQIDALDSENRAYYNRRYYEDATQRADNQAAITQAREALLRNNQRAEGQAAVMGATDASAAAMKEANNATIAQATSSIAANAAADKRHVEDSYRQQNANIRNKNAALAQRRGMENQAAIDGAVSGMNTLASTFIAGDTKLEGGANATNNVATPLKNEAVSAMQAKAEQGLANDLAKTANVLNNASSKTNQVNDLVQRMSNNQAQRNALSNNNVNYNGSNAEALRKQLFGW